LLPMKPGCSFGGAFRDVALAAHACGQKDKATEFLARAETLAQGIAGPWKVSELTRVANAWRTCGDTKRANALLTEAATFLAALPPLERAEEALTLARAQASAGDKTKARATLTAVVAEAERAENPEAWRKPRVRAMLAQAELGDK
jgi:hypothetical protein